MLTLHRLTLSYRILYSGVLLFMAAGTLVHTVHQEVRIGIQPAEVAAWYRGNEADVDATVLLFPRSFEEVWGDVWTAALTYTLALLIFGSILARSAAPPALRAGLLLGYTVGGAAAAAVPLLVRYAAPGWAWLDTAALVLLPGIAMAMAGIAIAEMWLRRTAGPRFDPARQA